MVESDKDHLVLDAKFDFPSGDPAWRLGLAAVVEETNGTITYWALTHPSGKPDFHHIDGFALEFMA